LQVQRQGAKQRGAATFVLAAGTPQVTLAGAVLDQLREHELLQTRRPVIGLVGQDVPKLDLSERPVYRQNADSAPRPMPSAMYVPPHFAITNPDALHRIIREHPLGILVTPTPDGPDANHIPFEFDPTVGEHGLLTAHVARANPLWQQCRDGAQVLVVFRGEQSYISPNWYPSKHETHRQVPTWNYEVVHAHGRLTVQDEEKFVRGVVARLTRTHEAPEPRPWKMGDSAPDYIDGMLRAIVGIEVAISRIEGKSKLSQNREVRDRLGAADALSGRGQGELARAMRGGN
jgi:transcriptional regulator